MIKTEDQYFRRLYDKKLVCAGLLCIFNLPSSAVPPAISGVMDKVCATTTPSYAFVSTGSHRSLQDSQLLPSSSVGSHSF